MSEKYVIEFDDKEFLIEGHSYRNIKGTSTLIRLSDIENLTPAESKEEEKGIIYGDEYLFINDCGDISLGIWENTNIDKFRKDSGNIFLTRKEAEFELKRKEIMGVIRKYAEPLNTPWDCENLHYYLVARLEGVKRVCIDCNWDDKSEGFYFATEIDAMKVIDEVGEADLLRYYFMVED